MRVDGEELLRKRKEGGDKRKSSLDRRKDSGNRCKLSSVQSLQSGPHPGSLRL